jgi:hypothetical protein
MHARDLPSNAKETATCVKVQIIGCEVVWSCQTKSSIVVPNVSVLKNSINVINEEVDNFHDCNEALHKTNTLATEVL